MFYTDNNDKYTERLPDTRPSCLAERCASRPWRVYVAHNIMLNKIAQTSPIIGGLQPFVFKVGMSRGCKNRTETLNSARIFTPPPAFKQGRAIYAGVSGWRIGRCWLPPIVPGILPQNYDSTVFRSWVTGGRGVPAVRGVKSITYQFFSAAKHNGSHTADELYVMDMEFLQSGKSGLAPHTLHDDMLSSARDVFKVLIEPILLNSSTESV